MSAFEGGRATPFWYTTGVQYADASADVEQLVLPPNSSAGSELAVVAVLPKKSCCIDMPVILGITIGSFGARSDVLHVSVKMPVLPVGNPAVFTPLAAPPRSAAPTAAGCPTAPSTTPAARSPTQQQRPDRRSRRDTNELLSAAMTCPYDAGVGVAVWVPPPACTRAWIRSATFCTSAP